MARTKQFDQQIVLQKAKDLFWKQGFHATSMQNLVDHLGINRASLYNTFGDKKALYEAAFQEYRNENAAFVNQHFSEYDSVREAIEALLIKVIGNAMQDPDRKGCFVVNCTTEYLPSNAEMLTQLLENKTTFEANMAAQLQKGIENGEFAKSLNTKAVATYIYALFSGLNVISKVENDFEEVKKSIALGMQVLA